MACDSTCDLAKLSTAQFIEETEREGQRVYARCFVLNGLAGPSADSPAKQRPPTPAEHSPGPI
ncbi:hypothetical protein HaLaN_31902 [Haematococcus lacustris]|uniref:Uncharacterized protein n=1 Tax=Haematococcus lacustris TaxID=44745 RepID=A0A6A0AID4_HAELA|nr:hypothetical protein HaLaN_31902 [Haematococcus lacustris]